MTLSTQDAPVAWTGSADERYAAALNSLSIHLAILDSAGRIVAVNDAWRRFAAENGAGDDASVSEGADYLASSCASADPHAEAATDGVRGVLSGALEEFRLEYPCDSPTEPRWFELRATPVRTGGLEGAVVAHTNITQRKLAEQRLHHLAHHDELTGLPNRRQLMDALASAQPSGRLGVALIDLDHFKAVNDSYGHGAGNEVLCAVAEALGRPLPGGSLAGRHGGDEFCVALFDSDGDSLIQAASTIRARALERLGRLPFAGEVSLSVGLTLAVADEPLAMALERADQALYAVKERGRDGYEVR